MRTCSFYHHYPVAIVGKILLDFPEFDSLIRLVYFAGMPKRDDVGNNPSLKFNLDY